MWRLKIVRKYVTKVGEYDFDKEAEFDFAFNYMSETIDMVEKVQEFGINGTFEYSIWKEGENE